MPETLAWIAANGFDGFQVWQRRIDAAGLKASDVATMARDLGLEVTAVGGGPNLVDPRSAQEAIDAFRGFLNLSVELGCRIVTAESKAKPDDLSDADAWASTAETVAAICAHAKDIVFTDAGGNAGQAGVRDVAAGEGRVGYPAYLSALAATGYDGYLTVEMHMGAETRRRQAVEAADNLRTLLAAASVR
ncbi:sugar phosphate isomerase/epimerase family protein [Jiangella alkaliphila]|uniref:sugar phosphate isomerase/epimerase family protein n=1 Tax=Jiangella alkaliphila TaxID=419479 RepID=UPI0006294B9E|nr:TIM barrel protein [Jiangella alkaliphila]